MNLNYEVTMKHLYFLRRILRALGLTEILGQLYSAEKRFGRLMLASIHVGDTVWDVGANVGLYEESILEKVGPQGTVYAFEPNPVSIAVMQEKFGAYSHLKLVNVGLGDLAGKMPLYVNSDPTSVTASLAPQHVDDEQHRLAHLVDVITGDAFASENGSPNVVKIDVEGFEVEVLRGLASMLGGGKVRNICIEVHFREMESRGVLDQFWEQDQRMLQWGYAAQWVDPSHVIYQR